MLRKAMDVGLFDGFKVGKVESVITISHLQFADDLLIFCGGENRQVRNIKRVLRVFELAAGLKLNLKKSKILGINIPEINVTDWAKSIGCLWEKFSTTYLGLPLGPRRNSSVLWDPVFKNFSKRLEGWKVGFLSIAGRLTLIKSVLSSLPIYFLSIFKIPASVLKKLNSLMAKFLWGESNEKAKIHWVGWNQICSSKSAGGLGVVNLEILNKSLLGKWIWRFGNEPSALWRKVISARLPGNPESILPVPSSNRHSSWIWQGISNTYFANDCFGHLLRSNLILQVGDDNNTHFWTDFWVGPFALKNKYPRVYILSCQKSGFVCEYGNKTDAGWDWQINLRRSLRDWEKEQWEAFMTTLNNFRSSFIHKDWIKWNDSSDGKYSVRSIRKGAERVFEGSFEWKDVVWLGVAPPKVEIFVWRAIMGRIPVVSELRKRGLYMVEDIRCKLCNLCEETPEHLFFDCFGVWNIWMSYCKLIGVHSVWPKSPGQFLNAWNGLIELTGFIWCRSIPFALIWSVWFMRNDIAFHNKKADWGQLAFLIRYRWVAWFKANNNCSDISFDSLFLDPSIAEQVLVKKSNKDTRLGWFPPPEGYLKLNVDGAFCPTSGRGGIGGILRDSKGISLMEFAESCEGGSPALTELAAAKEGVARFLNSQWADQHKLILETDCKTVFDWISGYSTPMVSAVREIGALRDQIHSAGLILKLIQRGQNMRADTLAKKGIG
ncbi:hypothetical protein HRI_000151000 [Hibiscus trionum]|uniref:Reverse transcriptase domain-containing protein n=1 Tax=Hibiscus trionum TaxID=183268 RepID=A0A9W7LHT1_HIBTR|nr:hypothetical protein HRI_000151000 [Hibiscus trionum]